MSELFLKIVNMSISASWLILAVIAVRALLRKGPKWVNVLLWAIVAVRLICPFSIESAMSLIPSTETISPEIMMDRTPEISTGIAPLDQAVNPVISTSFAPDPGASANPLQILIPVSANLWLLGMLVLFAYTAVSYLTLRHKIRTAVILRDNIFQCETVTSPFVLGIFQPRIYLPYTIDGNNLDHVVAHEQAHIRRKDHWWKPLGFLLLTIHWFNPFVWLAYVLLCRDIELACDEKVIAELGNEQRADYTQALVACSVNRRMIAACPLAFGEVGVKERVKSIMNYRKPTFWIIVAAVIVCSLVAVCFLTNPLDSVDYLMFTGWSDDPAEFGVMTFDINLGNRVMSGEIYVEEWTRGTCVRSAPVIMTQFVDSIHVTVRDRWDGDEKVGTEIHIDTNQYGGSLTTYFPYPEGYDGAIHFARNELNKRIKLSPGDEIILEARSYQCGNGIRPFTCKTLINSPSILESMDYMIVIRAVFSEDSLGVTKEEPITAPHHVLRAEILEIHDGYFLVEPVEGSWELSSAGRIEVPMKNMSPSPEPEVGDILEIEYDGQIMETYPARLNKIYHLALEQARYYSSAMIPTDTDLLGCPAGALLVPIDGNVYRYAFSEPEPEGITAETFLYTFTEETYMGDIVWEVYSLKEYPDKTAVLMVSGNSGAWLCRYSPPQRCSDTALADAISAGYVVMENGMATHGQDVWNAFYQQTRQGKPASVTIVSHYTLHPGDCSAEYYETYRQDYPCEYTYRVDFDGEHFTLTVEDGEDVSTITYACLMRYDNTEFYVESYNWPKGRYDYVLTQDDQVTWEQIWNSMISSFSLDDIDHYTIYSEEKP